MPLKAVTLKHNPKKAVPWWRRATWSLNHELESRDFSSSARSATNRKVSTARAIRDFKLFSNDLDNVRPLHQIDNQLAILSLNMSEQKFVLKKLISKQEFERTEADYKYNLRGERITYMMFTSVIPSIELNRYVLTFWRWGWKAKTWKAFKILDNLNIKAPIDGQLSTPHWEIGQAVNQGQRFRPGRYFGQLQSARAHRWIVYLPNISRLKSDNWLQ